MVSGGCIISGAVVRESLLFSDVRIEEPQHPPFRHPADTEIGALRDFRAVIDEGCEVPETPASAGSRADERRFHVTENGVVLVTLDCCAAYGALNCSRHACRSSCVAHAPAAVQGRLTGSTRCVTYLHAIKDYTTWRPPGRQPAARAVVNFTPLLIEQLEEIARCVAEHLEKQPAPGSGAGTSGPGPGTDRAGGGWSCCAPAACTAPADDRALRAVLELATSPRPSHAGSRRLRFRSVHPRSRVWYHLAWLGESVRRTDPLVAR